MAVTILPGILLYGIPDVLPVINGFTVTALKGHWLRATDGIRCYFVGCTDKAWLFFALDLGSGRPTTARIDPLLADRVIERDKFNESRA